MKETRPRPRGVSCGRSVPELAQKRSLSGGWKTRLAPFAKVGLFQWNNFRIKTLFALACEKGLFSAPLEMGPREEGGSILAEVQFVVARIMREHLYYLSQRNSGKEQKSFSLGLFPSPTLLSPFALFFPVGAPPSHSNEVGREAAEKLAQVEKPLPFWRRL